MRNYLFGYGSLISKQSRHKTAETGAAVPVTIQGFQRAWNLISRKMEITGVGVLPQKDSICNGILVEVEENQLPLIDKREMEGSDNNYERLEIYQDQIIQGEILNKSKMWIYVVKQPLIPTLEYPIAQSYLDVILTGCLEYGDFFANQFIQLTSGWEYHWINDRNCPRYERALSLSETQASKIDKLLKLQVKYFHARKDESC
jgi:hypothetical protein